MPRTLIVLVLAIGGCALVPNAPGPLRWDIDTGEVDDADLGRRDPYMQRAVRASESSVSACLRDASTPPAP